MKLLFVINSHSGNNSTNWDSIIKNHFKTLHYTIELYHLQKKIDIELLKAKIKTSSPDQVIAVGGDGTVKLIAELLLKTEMKLGILPAGSANGLAKELRIPDDPTEALDVIVSCNSKKIHAIKINNELCIHLSDIGFNAKAINEFDKLEQRGMFGYLKASLKVLRTNHLINVELSIDNRTVRVRAVVIVIANGTRYGTGAIINPVGILDDNLFEVVIVKKLSIHEILKMVLFHTPFNSTKTEIFRTDNLSIRSQKKVHFQIDGEYLGKINDIEATLIANAIDVIVPVASQTSLIDKS